MINQKPKIKNRAFTMLEVMVAIFVITIGVLGAYAVIQQIISYTLSSTARFTAAYLAKEGIEIVRNIRDTNWLRGNTWTDDMPGAGWITHTELPKYERRVTITPDGPDKLKVLVEVRWTEKGKTHTVTVQENLYNWY